AGRQCPETVAGFDGAAAQQYVALMGDQAAGDDARILVMNHLAMPADIAGAGISLRDGFADGVAAVTAEFHVPATPRLDGLRAILLRNCRRVKRRSRSNVTAMGYYSVSAGRWPGNDDHDMMGKNN